MKYFLALTMCAFSYSAVARASHWVEIAKSVSASSPTIVYLDDLNYVIEGSYKGFNIKAVSDKSFLTGLRLPCP